MHSEMVWDILDVQQAGAIMCEHITVCLQVPIEKRLRETVNWQCKARQDWVRNTLGLKQPESLL